MPSQNLSQRTAMDAGDAEPLTAQDQKSSLPKIIAFESAELTIA